jgi:hypothetical protein
VWIKDEENDPRPGRFLCHYYPINVSLTLQLHSEAALLRKPTITIIFFFWTTVPYPIFKGFEAPRVINLTFSTGSDLKSPDQWDQANSVSEVSNKKQIAGGQHVTPRLSLWVAGRGQEGAVIFLTGLRLGMDFFFFNLLKKSPVSKHCFSRKPNTHLGYSFFFLC